ncbi:MAG TPA: TIGR03087 family PEP-CTERM/XrtA system glycosyltransferase [Burkholderiaceae bacterium]
MDHLLFLAHRIPFPPNKGDKIRSYHLLKHLAERYHVHLGTFIDDEHDWQYVDKVKGLCASTYFGRINPGTARVKSLAGLLTGEPLSLAYYRDAGLRRWIGETMRQHPVERFFVFSSAMAQFVPPHVYGKRVIDFVDIDSDKWAQYAANKSWPASLIYKREARRLLAYERRIAGEFDASLFVSDAEAQLFRTMAPEHAQKISYFANGVDTDYFSPAHSSANPYPADQAAIVFTGAMDYWPNIDAVDWFASKVLPNVRAQVANAVFYIVGSKPSSQVQALGKLPGVVVTGRVEDVRPYLAHARCAVAPLRIARGIQNKVLEAMAMAKTVLVTPQALEGIAAVPGRDLLLAETEGSFARQVVAQLCQHNPDLGASAREIAVGKYGWASNLARVDQCFASMPATSGLPAGAVLRSRA